MRSALVIIAAVALCAANGASARSHHRAPKAVAQPATTNSANVPEKNRHPDDVALDRKIKGICRGC